MNDEQIIALFFQRNEQAIRETDLVYGRKLFMLSDHILNNHQDAEESVSDTYMEAWKTIPPKHPTYFYAFLASVCRNLSLNRLDWRLAAKRNAEVVALTQEMEMCIPDKRKNLEEDGRELRRILETFLDSLPKESRLIFLRRYLTWTPWRRSPPGTASAKARSKPSYTGPGPSCTTFLQRRVSRYERKGSVDFSGKHQSQIL